jgi:hypothetical protein
MQTVIYFLQVEGADGVRVKAGKADDLQKRVRQHERAGGVGARVKITTLCAVRGMASDEGAVKKYFSPCAISGETEVFKPASELVDYVRWLRDQYFVFVPESDDLHDLIGAHDSLVVDSRNWLPNPERVKPGPQVIFGFNGPLNLPPRVVTGDDFYTHSSIIEAAREAMDGIDLDPASHPVANQIVKASVFFGHAENGLVREWWGRVWINPPFSAWADWSEKASEEFRSGRVNEMCALASTRSMTAKYIRRLKSWCSAIVIFDGRIPFWGPKAGTPDEGHVVMYFGKNREKFRDAFRDLGDVFYPA